MITLRLLREKISVPQTWQEMTFEQVMNWVEAICLGLNAQEQRSYIICRMSKKYDAKQLRSYLDTLTNDDKEKAEGEIYRASEALKFLEEKNTLTFEQVRVPEGFTLPKAELTDFKAMEFVLASQYFVAFNKSKNIKDLDELLCVLLRQEKGKGERKPLNEAELEYMHRKIKYVSLQEKFCIYKGFEGEYLRLIETYPQVFEQNGQEGQEVCFPYDFITNNAGEKFGTVDKVEQTEVHIILQAMVHNIEEYNKMKKANESME